MSFDAPSWIDSVAAGAANAGNWLATADQLKRGSDLLRTIWLTELRESHSRLHSYMAGEVESLWQPWVGGPAMTLAALALENLLKGLAIAANPGLVRPHESRPEQLFDKRLTTHDLERLTSLAGFAVSTEEQRLLRRLTEFVKWAGRYPFPLNAMDSAPRDGAESGGSSFTSEWFDPLDVLFERLRNALTEAAIRADRARELTVAEEKGRRRPEILAALERLARVEVEPDVIVFETDLPDEPGHSISCRCGVTFNLNPRRPAGICRCGTLFFGEKRGVAAR